MNSATIDRALSGIEPTSSEGADLLLDLRQLLLDQGHPGKCVRCFFGLLGDLRQPGALRPIRLWLERNLEIVVHAKHGELETLPLELSAAGDLEDFCQRAIRTVREDRAYRDRELTLRFRFRDESVTA